MRARRRFLVAAAVWDVVVGTVSLRLPEGRVARSRRIGVVVLAFAGLYALLAVRPSRPLLIASVVAKGIGGSSGVVGVLQGKRDRITLLALADAAWLPGFVLAARR